ncbi:predicted protein [Nematostella vectensis]|uniref:Peptidase S74 domain-containing protein n=1 Tax=Nematostella vectensis TaxID=45351 RepID=A7RXK0_NEMVE|nr:predicted protein [Nematostella vectensis]|eukprot:XP_001635922.1 predicted protein [Nematostella vectensis]
MTHLAAARVVSCLLLVVLSMTTCNGTSAKQLLRYDYATERFITNDDALKELSKLRRPVRVIGAIGDARVGKSTTLNHIEHVWRGGNQETVAERVFNTSNQVLPCTRGVWLSVTEQDAGSLVLLDVEGSDLGDDAKTSQMSIFTALMSSALMLFGEGGLANHNRDFMFRLTRVTQEITRDEMLDGDAHVFPSLRVVLRQALEPPDGETLRSFIVGSLVGENDVKAAVIRKYFPESKTTVSVIPAVSELKQASDQDSKALENAGYRQAIADLVKNLQSVPAKRARGAQFDGPMLRQLALDVVVALNKNSWAILADTFTSFEISFCEKAFRTFIKPLDRRDHPQIRNTMESALQQFSKECVLSDEKTKAKNWLEEAIRVKQNAEEKQRLIEQERRKAEDEIRKQKELEKQRKQEEELQRKRMEEESRRRETEEKRRKEEMEKSRRAEQQREQERRRLEETRDAEKRAQKAKKKNKIVKTVAAVIGLGILFSDERLKQNITTIPGADYEAIGLREVEWVWRSQAGPLGLEGRGRGVIAQEVEGLYPAAVRLERNGYKRVDYGTFLYILNLDNANSIQPCL